MKKIMETSLVCLLVALGLHMGMSQGVAPNKIFTENPKIENYPRDIILANGMSGHWATIQRFNKRDTTAKGYDPSFTVIFSKYKPIVKKINDIWQITFTSEIAEDLP